MPLPAEDALIRDLADRLELAIAKIEELIKANEELLRRNAELVQRYE